MTNQILQQAICQQLNIIKKATDELNRLNNAIVDHIKIPKGFTNFIRIEEINKKPLQDELNFTE